MALEAAVWSGIVNVVLFSSMLGLGLLSSSLLAGQGFTGSWGSTADKNRSNQSAQCEWLAAEDRLPAGYWMATKTPYQFLAAVEDEGVVGTCTAVQVYGVLRHGIRYPSPKYISEWNGFQTELQARLRDGTGLTPEARKLRKWVNPFAANEQRQLTERGMREQYCLAKRFMKRFPRLLRRNYSEDVFSLRTTQIPRTVRSGMSFAFGLFEGGGPLNGFQPVNLESSSLNEDYLLRFFDMKCPRFDQHVTNNKTLSQMIQSFLNSTSVTSVVESLQKIIDPRKELWNLTISDVSTMYKICIHERSIFGHSMWCPLFEPGDGMAPLEYYSDLKSYWTKGYGFDVNWLRAQPLVADIMSWFLNYAKAPDDSKLAALRFSHAEVLIPLVSFFGLFKDAFPLLPSNFPEMRGRHFASRKIASYSGSVVFVLYKCADQPEESTYQVRVLVNEQDVVVPECLGSGGVGRNGVPMCPLAQLWKLAEDKTGGLDFQQLCAISNLQ